MVKSWNDRLNTAGINGIKPSPRTVADVVEGQSMLVPTARQVDDFIRSIPKGVEMDVRALRTALGRSDMSRHHRLSSAHRRRGRQ